MSDLKAKIARGEYEIDASEVAEAIITKLRTVRRVRATLDAAPRRPAARTRLIHAAAHPSRRRRAAW